MPKKKEVAESAGTEARLSIRDKRVYIRGDERAGLLYDWKEIRKVLNKLGIPKEFYNPSTAPLDVAKWFVEMSERAVGKTTGWLLLGMVMYWLYGTVTCYVRPKKDMIAPSKAGSLFNVINDCEYVSKLTGGAYRGIVYKTQRWYFCNYDEAGNITTTCPTYFCRMLSIDQVGAYKSTVNEPYGDLILLDEFIPVAGRCTPQSEFVNFCDLISTVFRLREGGKIVLLANTINKYNQYFSDLEIFEQVATMQISENMTYTTDGGTKIYIEMIGAPRKYRTKKESWVRLFMGFRKPELSAITGTATWAVKNYQHIPDETDTGTDEPPIPLFNKVYIRHSNKLCQLEWVRHPTLGVIVYAHWATRTYDDSVILSIEDVYDKRQLYGTAPNTNIGKRIDQMIRMKKIYFSGNDVGSFVENYYGICGYSSLRNYW